MLKIDETIINNDSKKKRIELFNKKLKNLTIPNHLEKYIINHARDMVNGFNVYDELNESITEQLFERQDLLQQAICDHWLAGYTDSAQGIFWEVGDYLIWGDDELLYLNGKDSKYFIATNVLEEVSYFLVDEIYNLTNISYLYRMKEYEKRDNMVVDHELKVCYYENPGWKLGFGICRILDIKEELQTLRNMFNPIKEQVTVTVDKDLYEQFIKQQKKVG